MGFTVKSLGKHGQIMEEARCATLPSTVHTRPEVRYGERQPIPGLPRIYPGPNDLVGVLAYERKKERSRETSRDATSTTRLFGMYILTTSFSLFSRFDPGTARSR